MNETIDFTSRIKSVTRILEIGEYTNAATECVKLIEQALRQVVSLYLERVDEKVKDKIQKEVHKRDRRGKGIDSLTMGQLVHVLRESEFLEALARVSGKDLTSLRIINFEKLTQLRNKVMHEGAEATHAEAELLFRGLHVILETFELAIFEEADGPQRSDSTGGRTESSEAGNTQSIHIAGNASGNIFQKGDYNTASMQYQHVTLPSPESVDIQAELAAIRETLAQLHSADKKKIENAISDAEEELKKPKPEKDEVGKALDRALDYAKKAEGFAGVMGKLKPHIVNAATWLGSNWHKILSVVGLVT